MLTSKATMALLPTSSVVGVARVVGPLLADALARGFAKDAGSSVESIKEAARKGGDAAKEWMTGASQHAGSTQEKVRPTAEGVYEAAKRGADDVTRSAHEAASRRGFAELKEKAAQAVGAAQQKATEVAEEVAAAAKEAVGGERKLASARAVWEAGRDEKQKAEEQSSRKSQLTDEAHGDNPKEATARDDKQILESDFYTKA